MITAGVAVARSRRASPSRAARRRPRGPGRQTGPVSATGFETLLGGVADAVVATARDRPAVLAAGLLALLTVSWTASWRLTRGVVTIAHEGGHALVAVLAGRGLGGIRLHADSSGVTTSVGHAGAG